MIHRLASHLRHQALGALALFLVLTGGTAFALAGSNTVFSDDIVNGEVKPPDLDLGAVTSAKLQDNGVYSADVRDDTLTGGGLAAADLRPSSVRSSEVLDDSVKGGDVNEASLGGEIQSAVRAEVSGIGRDTVISGGCHPMDTTFVDCGYVRFHDVPVATRYLVVASARIYRDESNGFGGVCAIQTNQGRIDASEVGTFIFSGEEDGKQIATTAVTGLEPAGIVDIGLACRVNSNSPDLIFDDVRISAMAISNN